jgi:unsaturated rhamnogalacturonyl hydrolase
MQVFGANRRQAGLGSALKAAIVLSFLLCTAIATPQSKPVSQQVADSAMARWPDGRFTLAGGNGHWNDGFGLLLEGLAEEWYGTANPAYYRYIERSVGSLVAADGSITGPEAKADPAATIAMGRALLLLYRVTRQEKYWKVATALLQQYLSRPHGQFASAEVGQRSSDFEAGEQVYNVEAFLAEYASLASQPQDSATDKAHLLAEEAQWVSPGGSAQPSTDESGKKVQARRVTNLAWFMMILVDTFPDYPGPGRPTLLRILENTAKAAAGEQDLRTGFWPSEPGARTMTASVFAYAFARAIRMGYLAESYSPVVDRAYAATKTGLKQGEPDATDPGTAGVMVLTSREMEIRPQSQAGRGKKGLVDAWFNSQTRHNAAGQSEFFHYKWDDYSDSGFSLLGHLFNDYGIATETLYAAPTAANLAGAQFYIVVSPDIPVKNPNPHYMTKEDAGQIARWVEQGGVLVIMENDPANADIEHMNLLADLFGLHFNSVLSHHVEGDNFSMGRIETAGDKELFDRPHVLYMKDTCTISPSGSARPLLTDKGDVMMATAKHGEGTVFAVVDPWLYNEYTDGRKLPPGYDNFKGAQALVRWLIRQGEGAVARQMKK